MQSTNRKKAEKAVSAAPTAATAPAVKKENKEGTPLGVYPKECLSLAFFQLFTDLETVQPLTFSLSVDIIKKRVELKKETAFYA